LSPEDSVVRHACRGTQHLQAAHVPAETRRETMKMSFRWYGKDDPVTLTNIRQIPGIVGLSPQSTTFLLARYGQSKKSKH
jgi:hypothetical protein